MTFASSSTHRLTSARVFSDTLCSPIVIFNDVPDAVEIVATGRAIPAARRRITFRAEKSGG